MLSVGIAHSKLLEIGDGEEDRRVVQSYDLDLNFWLPFLLLLHQAIRGNQLEVQLGEDTTQVSKFRYLMMGNQRECQTKMQLGQIQQQRHCGHGWHYMGNLLSKLPF